MASSPGRMAMTFVQMFCAFGVNKGESARGRKPTATFKMRSLVSQRDGGDLIVAMYHVNKKIELKKVAGKVSSFPSDYSAPVINLSMCNPDA
jgi:hypothetical protein